MFFVAAGTAESSEDMPASNHPCGFVHGEFALSGKRHARARLNLQMQEACLWKLQS
jgi:hypothetical protein